MNFFQIKFHTVNILSIKQQTISWIIIIYYFIIKIMKLYAILKEKT